MVGFGLIETEVVIRFELVPLHGTVVTCTKVLGVDVVAFFELLKVFLHREPAELQGGVVVV